MTKPSSRSVHSGRRAYHPPPYWIATPFGLAMTEKVAGLAMTPHPVMARSAATKPSSRSVHSGRRAYYPPPYWIATPFGLAMTEKVTGLAMTPYPVMARSAATKPSSGGVRRHGRATTSSLRAYLRHLVPKMRSPASPSPGRM